MWSLMDNNVSEQDRQILSEFILTSDRLTNGPKVRSFEENWSEWLGTEHSLMVNSGASGNYITIALLKHLVGTGEVIVPAIGWSSDVSSLLQLGFTPVFVDVNLNNFGVNEDEVINSINKQIIELEEKWMKK